MNRTIKSFIIGKWRWFTALIFVVASAPAAVRGADATPAQGAWKLQAVWKGHAAEVKEVAFAPDGKTAASLSGDGVIILWDVAAGKSKATLRVARATIVGLGYGPEGKTLLAVSQSGIVKVWDPATAREKSSVRLGLRGGLAHGAFSADGKVLATTWDENSNFGGAPGQVVLWDAGNGKKRGTLAGNETQTYFLRFSPDGKKLATGGENCLDFGQPPSANGTPLSYSVKLWNLANGKNLGSMALGTVAAFSPDGKLLVTNSSGAKPGKESGYVRLWDLTKNKQKAILKGDHASWLAALAFSPDGKLIASAGDDKTAKVWDVATGKVTATLKGHTGIVNGVAFSPDSQSLITVSADKTVRLWTSTSKSPGETKEKK
jgi:WD40 repeat protein